MRYEINSYIAVLIITLVGAGASLLIIKVANNTTYDVIYSDPVYTGG